MLGEPSVIGDLINAAQTAPVLGESRSRMAIYVLNYTSVNRSQ